MRSGSRRWWTRTALAATAAPEEAEAAAALAALGEDVTPEAPKKKRGKAAAE